jgi:hypothetical protein
MDPTYLAVVSVVTLNAYRRLSVHFWWLLGPYYTFAPWHVPVALDAGYRGRRSLRGWLK